MSNTIVHNKDSNYDLSILVSLNGLSFSIWDHSKDELIKLHHEDFNEKINDIDLLQKVVQLFSSNPYLTDDDFRLIKVIYNNELTTFVPTDFFDENNIESYLKYNNKLLSTDFISFDLLVNKGLVNVFIPFGNIHRYFFDRFKNFTYTHASSLLVDNIINYHKFDLNNFVYINLHHHSFEIVAIENGKLNLFNWFSFSHQNDILYYVLFIYEQLNWNPKTIPLKILGEYQDFDELFNEFKKFIVDVSFSKRLDDFSVSSTIDELKEYEHFELLSSY